MTALEQLLKSLEDARLNATQGKWWSFYHNRTDTWAVTFEKENYDQINNIENIIAQVCNDHETPGSSKYSHDFDFIADCANHILQLIEIIRVQKEAFSKIKVYTPITIQEEIDKTNARVEAIAKKGIE